MPRKRRYPITAILELYATGISQAEVGRRLGYHHTTVGYALDLAKVQRHSQLAVMRERREKEQAERTQRAIARVQRIVRMYKEEHLSTPQIASILHESRSTIYQILRAQQCVVMRPKGVRVRYDVKPKSHRPPRREDPAVVERLMQLAFRRKKGQVA
jgi:DNA-binding CsgD family transcriptional regulator